MSATPPPYRIRSRQRLDVVLREAEQSGARLMAGGQFANKREREHVGLVLSGLADLVKRLDDAGRLSAYGEDL